MRTLAQRLALALLIPLFAPSCSDEAVSALPSSIQVSDQSPESPHDVVTIDEVYAEASGWVVVYQDAAGGYGRQLGYSAVNQGTSRNVNVALARTCVDGETLHALVHLDRGQEGDFEFPGPDEPALDASSLPVGASFIVSVPDQTLPALEVDNQTLTEADKVTLTLVRATAPGRVVIKSQAQNAPADIIGVLSVDEGTIGGSEAPAVVTLDRDAKHGELLYAILQRRISDEGDGTYEDEFDLLSNGPMMVLFTVSIAGTEESADAIVTGDAQAGPEDIVEPGPTEDIATEDGDAGLESASDVEDVSAAGDDADAGAQADAESDAAGDGEADSLDIPVEDTSASDVTEADAGADSDLMETDAIEDAEVTEADTGAGTSEDAEASEADTDAGVGEDAEVIETDADAKVTEADSVEDAEVTAPDASEDAKVVEADASEDAEVSETDSDADDT